MTGAQWRSGVPEGRNAARAAASIPDGFPALALANIGVAVAAFGIASAMAIMQALSRANLDLPFRQPACTTCRSRRTAR